MITTIMIHAEQANEMSQHAFETRRKGSWNARREFEKMDVIATRMIHAEQAKEMSQHSFDIRRKGSWNARWEL